jgi:hypothetical protein
MAVKQRIPQENYRRKLTDEYIWVQTFNEVGIANLIITIIIFVVGFCIGIPAGVFYDVDRSAGQIDAAALRDREALKNSAIVCAIFFGIGVVAQFLLWVPLSIAQGKIEKKVHEKFGDVTGIVAVAAREYISTMDDPDYM